MKFLFVLSFSLMIQAPVAPEFQKADLNKDGLISHQEVLDCIESYFYGSQQFSEEELVGLIDYFFEQGS
ncbi:MAG: hypothetical protein AAF193_05990 [Bacteroidota bacterium]